MTGWRIRGTAPRGRDRGFTLLEVMVAFAIAALALAMLFSGSLAGMVSAQTATSYEQAVARARSHLAAETVTLVPGDRQGDDGGGYRWHVRVRPVDSFRRRVEEAEAQGLATTPVVVTLFAIEVGISWTAAGRTREVRLDSARLGPGPRPLR